MKNFWSRFRSAAVFVFGYLIACLLFIAAHEFLGWPIELVVIVQIVFVISFFVIQYRWWREGWFED